MSKKHTKISADEIRKGSRSAWQKSFKTGKHMTEKDRPRKKLKPRDVDEM